MTDRTPAGWPARKLPSLVPAYQLKVTAVTVAVAVISMTWGDATFSDAIVRWIMAAAAAGLGVAFLSTVAALAIVVVNVASLAS